MKKLFSVLIAALLCSGVVVQAQLLNAVNDSPEGGSIPPSANLVGGRYNAPQAVETNFTIPLIDCSVSPCVQPTYKNVGFSSDADVYRISFQKTSGTNQKYEIFQARFDFLLYKTNKMPLRYYNKAYNAPKPGVYEVYTGNDLANNTGKLLGKNSSSYNSSYYSLWAHTYYPTYNDWYYEGYYAGYGAKTEMLKINGGTITVAYGLTGPYMRFEGTGDLNGTSYNLNMTCNSLAPTRNWNVDFSTTETSITEWDVNSDWVLIKGNKTNSFSTQIPVKAPASHRDANGIPYAGFYKIVDDMTLSSLSTGDAFGNSYSYLNFYSQSLGTWGAEFLLDAGGYVRILKPNGNIRVEFYGTYGGYWYTNSRWEGLTGSANLTFGVENITATDVVHEVKLSNVSVDNSNSNNYEFVSNAANVDGYTFSISVPKSAGTSWTAEEFNVYNLSTYLKKDGNIIEIDDASGSVTTVSGKLIFDVTFVGTNREQYHLTNKPYITFLAEDGSTVLQEGFCNYNATPSYSGSTPTKPEDASYVYEFSGWSPTITNATTDKTYTAQFNSIAKYTITLNNQGADTGHEGTATVTALKDRSTNLTSAITKPTKIGHTFGGYYTDTNGGGTQIIDANGNFLANKSDVSYTYTDASRNWKYVGNITLYAKWTVNTHKVTVNVSPSGYGTVRVGSGSEQSSVNVTEVPYNTAYSTTGNVLTIGSTLATVTATAASPDPDDGYTYSFSSWSSASGNTPDNDLTLTANFTRRATAYTITYNGLGGASNSNPDSYTIEMAENLVLADPGERDGFEFTGWTDDDNSSAAVTSITAGTYGNRNFTAHWEVAQRTVTIGDHAGGTIMVTDGATAITSDSQAYAPNSTITLTATPDEDYAFVRWTVGTPALSSETTVDGVRSGTFTLTENVTVGAEFRRVHYDALTLKDGVTAGQTDIDFDEFSETYNDVTVEEVTYNRTFTEGRWSTLCLPFDVSKYNLIDNGLLPRQVYEFKYAEEAESEGKQGFYLHFYPVEEMVAGRGYLVKTTADRGNKFVFYDVTINTAADNADIEALTSWKESGYIGIVGTLRNGILPSGSKQYMGLSNNKIYFSGTSTTVPAYRAFFKYDDGHVPAVAPRVRIVVEDEQATPIEVIEMDGEGNLMPVSGEDVRKYIEDGVLIIERNGKRYNAVGAEL